MTVHPLPFKGDLIEYLNVGSNRLDWLWRDGEAYIAARPICAMLGLAYQPQHRKLTDPNSEACVTMMVTHDTIGREQEMLCIAYPDFMIWLATLEIGRVKPQAREAVRSTRNEIKLLIANYYHRRLFGEIEARSDLYNRLRIDALKRKPLRFQVLEGIRIGWDFDKIKKSGSASRPKLVETIGDMIALGLISEAPAGTPFVQPLAPSSQIDMFAELKSQNASSMAEG